MPTKFGELWSTNGENGTVLQLAQNQLFQMLISQRLRGVMMTRDGSVSSNFLTPKIRKLAKNLVYFSLYHRGLLWELRQTFLLSREKNFVI